MLYELVLFDAEARCAMCVCVCLFVCLFSNWEHRLQISEANLCVHCLKVEMASQIEKVVLGYLTD